ncbi:MAG: DUF2238 domain-containing protein [Verrucomicrobiales bacterium]|nr:DUF2238 domain-containing protein [Verrucomicrobiales bacterium]
MSPPDFPAHRRFVFRLSFVYLLFWIALAIKPLYPKDWWLENIVVAVGILVLLIAWRWYVLSRTSHVLIFVFLLFHGIGAHYTYSEVPLQDWANQFIPALSETLSRNHYDRFVHFAYGLLLFFPFREVFLHVAKVRATFWTYLVPFSFVLATSLLYELLEWAAAIVLGGDLGMAFLGTQGDIWDAQQDSFWALIGSLLASLALLLHNHWKNRDSAREWAGWQDSPDWRESLITSRNDSQ